LVEHEAQATDEQRIEDEHHSAISSQLTAISYQLKAES